MLHKFLIWGHNQILGQNLVTKLVVPLNYNFTQYIFIGGEF